MPNSTITTNVRFIPSTDVACSPRQSKLYRDCPPIYAYDIIIAILYNSFVANVTCRAIHVTVSIISSATLLLLNGAHFSPSSEFAHVTSRRCGHLRQRSRRLDLRASDRTVQEKERTKEGGGGGCPILHSRESHPDLFGRTTWPVRSDSGYLTVRES